MLTWLSPYISLRKNRALTDALAIRSPLTRNLQTSEIKTEVMQLVDNAFSAPVMFLKEEEKCTRENFRNKETHKVLLNAFSPAIAKWLQYAMDGGEQPSFSKSNDNEPIGDELKGKLKTIEKKFDNQLENGERTIKQNNPILESLSQPSKAKYKEFTPRKRQAFEMIDDENVPEIAVDDVTCGGSANAQEDQLDNVGSGRLEAMLQKIKLYLVERSTYAKSKLKFLIPMNEIPPIIPPMQGKAKLNTETSKKSVYLKDELDSKDGDPVMLSKYIKDNDISVAHFDSMNKEKLTIIAQYCKTATNGVSIYSGIKFLILTESVRDASDLCLLLRHPPITFNCDAVCKFVRHINIREPRVARDYWGAYDGCFEIPSAKNKLNSLGHNTYLHDLKKRETHL
eukprot:gene1577-1743_t